MVHRPGRKFNPRFDRRCVEIEQADRPTVRPRPHQRLDHLKIDVPTLGVFLRRPFTQPRPLRKSLNRRNPRPEAVLDRIDSYLREQHLICTVEPDPEPHHHAYPQNSDGPPVRVDPD